MPKVKHHSPSSKLLAGGTPQPINFKAQKDGFHYHCPNCGRKYFSNVLRNPTCSYMRGCTGNPRLVLSNKRKKTSASSDEVDLDKVSAQRPRRGQVSMVENTPIFPGENRADVERELANADEDLNDFDYEPPARDPYNIVMRLTGGPQRWKDGARDPKVVGVDPTLVKPSPSVDHTIAGKANRPRTTGQAMGIAIKGKGTISAAKYSKLGKKFFKGSKKHYEWCHLVGDSLGGDTTADNLIAGSYGCNTYMATIEKLLIGKTQLVIKVTALCNMRHVAEFIRYEIWPLGKPGSLMSYMIDATNFYFTSDDMTDIQNELSNWMKSVGVKVT